MLSRFEKFDKTNMYQNFNECIQWNSTLIDIADIDMYHNNLEFLRTTFEVTGYPNEDEINFYIENMECIDNKDLDEFKLYIGIIFEKSFDSHHACRELVNKNINNEKKNIQKTKIQNDKESIKEQKQLEKDEQRRLKAELKEQQRERKKQDLEKYNSEIITCYCGLDYIRNKRVYHMTSSKHEIRLECIKWILNPEIYKKYSNNNFDIDDTSISSFDSL